MSDRPLVVGVLNCTPDSFFAHSRSVDAQAAIARGHQMLSQGADWLDVGGESTRPGATAVGIDEELSRVLPVVQALAPHTRVCIDTRNAAVAAACLRAGAQVINDVTGLEDPEMCAVSADARAVVVMHSRGTPESMGGMTSYNQVVHDVRDQLLERASRARCAEVWLDPGIGFAKTAAQSLRLLGQLDSLVSTGLPVYLGASRKSFIGHTLGLSDPADRLTGSLAAAAAGYAHGARAFRVHDVRETRELLDMLRAIDDARRG